MEQKESSMAYAAWLDQIAGLGNKTKRKLAEQTGGVKQVYQMSKTEAKELIGEKKAECLLKAQKETDPERIYEQLAKKQIGFCWYGQNEYPDRLLSVEDAPFGLYVKGKLPEKQTAAVAIVGARVCSGYGVAMAKEFGEKLARAGIQIISGMARGVDGMCQWAASQAGGGTYAVLGCGVDICYPEQNRTLYEALIAKGGVLSEYLPGTMPKPALFPPRNRIISGMADALVVIEAREKSGTLITVDMALEQGRDVYVLPGRVTDALSMGCNKLIGQGAGIVLSAEELICELVHKPSVLSTLDYYPKPVEEIQKEAGIGLTEAMYQLVKLCTEGKAEQVSSFYFIKK